jgi:hypothetical protein
MSRRALSLHNLKSDGYRGPIPQEEKHRQTVKQIIRLTILCAEVKNWHPSWLHVAVLYIGIMSLKSVLYLVNIILFNKEGLYQIKGDVASSMLGIPTGVLTATETAFKVASRVTQTKCRVLNYGEELDTKQGNGQTPFDLVTDMRYKFACTSGVSYH